MLDKDFWKQALAGAVGAIIAVIALRLLGGMK